jgi:hypothetical protein
MRSIDFRKLLIGLLALFVILLYIGSASLKQYNQAAYLSFISKNITLGDFNSTEIEGQVLYELKSECECRKNQNIILTKNGKKITVYYSNRTKRSVKNVLQMEDAEFVKRSFTCDPYKVLRRGQNQKTIGFSLYGKKKFYYDKLKTISKQIKELYPGWLMRVYYDSSIDRATICEIECLEQNSSLIDNSDFCNINSMFLNYKDFVTNQSLDAQYIHSMKWRWYFNSFVYNIIHFYMVV